MNQLSKDDLNELFQDKQNDDESLGEPIKLKKMRSNKEIRNVRKIIRRVKSHKTPNREVVGEFVNSILRFAAFSGFAGFIIFIAMGWSGFADQLRWSYFVDFKGEPVQKISSSAKVTPTPSPKPTTRKTPKPIIDNLQNPSNLPELALNFSDNELTIEKIGITAPIQWEVPEQDILKSLASGVAQYKGTSLPGNGGNIFITGHSSNYFWIQSDYNHIFALLDKLESGDRIEVSRKNKKYVYEVKESKTVNPDNVEVLENTPKETLTLMTCWPIGTSINRLLVLAEFMYSYSAN